MKIEYFIVLALLRIDFGCGCPAKCRCASTATYCVYKGITSEELTNIAPLIPITTEKLYLSGNKLSRISPQDFKHLRKLKYLSANFNRISELPEQIGETLPQLKMLYLTANQITTVTSRELTGYHNIQVLNLDQNNINKIEDFTFSKLSNLKELLLGHNKLTEIGNKTFNGLGKLIKLQLNDNQIRRLHENAFRETSSLQEIFLSDNNLTIVQNNIFSHLENLRTLYLNGNSITRIETGAFEHLKAQRINLNKNRLSNIPRDFLRITAAIGAIYLLDNPFSCDCNLALVVQKSDNLHFGKCYTPLTVRGRTIESVTFSELNCALCDVYTCPRGERCVANITSRNVTCFTQALNLKEIDKKNVLNKKEAVGHQPSSYISWIVAISCAIAAMIVTLALFIHIKNRRKRKAFQVNRYIYEQVEAEGKKAVLTSLTSKNSFNIVVHTPKKIQQYFV